MVDVIGYGHDTLDEDAIESIIANLFTGGRITEAEYKLISDYVDIADICCNYKTCEKEKGAIVILNDGSEFAITVRKL